MVPSGLLRGKLANNLYIFVSILIVYYYYDFFILRYIDYELRGFIRDTQRDISKTECEDLCLGESRCWLAVNS